MRHRLKLLIVIALGFLTLVACAPFLRVAVHIGVFALTHGPGIGDEEEAKRKIQIGMTKDEVRSVLGPPHHHEDGGGHGDGWLYRCDFFGGTLFRVCFGPDDRVTERYWWLD